MFEKVNFDKIIIYIVENMNFEIIITLIILLLILLYLLAKIKDRKLNPKDFKSYSEFLGQKSKDPYYNKKMHIIINLINKKCITDINEIARLSNCGLEECILKIKFLKKQKIIENYYIDRANGLLNLCSQEDKELIEKYDQFIYSKKLQPGEIARMLPSTRLDKLEQAKNKVLEELSYLDKKDLLNGINIDLVDKRIIYYEDVKSKNHQSYVSIICESCGATNEVPGRGKAKCEYCGRILEEEEPNN